jgi:hypothetical protein
MPESTVTRICPSCGEQVDLEDFNEGSELCPCCEDLLDGEEEEEGGEDEG